MKVPYTETRFLKRFTTEIILIIFCLMFFTCFGKVAWGAEANYVEPVPQENFAEQIAHAWNLFQEDIEHDFSDMGIALAQRDLIQRINSILSQYDLQDFVQGNICERRMESKEEEDAWYEEHGDWLVEQQSELFLDQNAAIHDSQMQD